MIAWPGVAFARKRVRWGEVVAIARCDFAIWRPVPDNSRQPSIRATQVIMHSMASPGTSPQDLIRYWSRPGTPLESHFIVGRDGRAWQLVDTGRSADANYRANRRPDGTGAISIETEDNIGNPDTLPWTQAQIDTLVRLALWAARVHGVPRRRCPSPSAPGIGFHTMFGAPSAWTPVSKTCPGTIRIRQFNRTVLPAIVAGTAGGGLSVADANSLERHLDVIQEKIERTFNQVNIKTGDLANRVEKLESKVERTFNQVNATTNALSVQHEELAAQVAQLQADMELVKDALNIP
jgi:outer membrane murein-binding lipoprotein Lpp